MRRKAQRASARHHFLADAHEKTGDADRERHLYTEAARHYEDALKESTRTSSDRLRISEKLAQVLWLGNDPNTAGVYLDTVIPSYRSDSQSTENFVSLLLRTAGQLWVDARTEATIPILEQAVQMAKQSNDASLYKNAAVVLANYLNVLGRFGEAERVLHGLGDIDSNDSAKTQTLYHLQWGIAVAASGKIEAYEYFERAMLLAKGASDPFYVTNVSGDYAIWAMALGNIQMAKSCREQALLVVRRYGPLWRVPHLCLGYAEVLMRMGDHQAAKNYVLEALESDAHALLVDERIVSVGIPLALVLNDREMLSRCSRHGALTSAFQSGESSRIGQVCTGFARLHAAQGNKRKAGDVLRRALGSISYVDECMDFPAEIARQGSLSDVPRARALLERRAKFSSNDVVLAQIALFDAIVAKRQRESSETTRHALDAARRFDALGWRAHAEEARSLVAVAHRPILPRQAPTMPLAGLMLMLSEREREVAGLVLRGLTNRNIATELKIREHTVEKHMASIMNRLGIRSRHQLADFIESSTP